MFTKEKQHVLLRHAVFLLRIVSTIHLIINYLSKIIYHNITPSADYDATTLYSNANKI